MALHNSLNIIWECNSRLWQFKIWKSNAIKTTYFFSVCYLCLHGISFDVFSKRFLHSAIEENSEIRTLIFRLLFNVMHFVFFTAPKDLGLPVIQLVFDVTILDKDNHNIEILITT